MRNEWQVPIVLSVDFLRLSQRLIDHLGKFLHAGAEDLGEVDGLCGLALEAGHRRDQRVKIGVRIGAKQFRGGLCARQVVLLGVVHDESEFLLGDVRLGPRLAGLRQKDAADQRRQLFVA